MSNLKFLSNNLVDSAVITASTTNANYPVSNIQDDRRTKTFRSTSNSDNLVFDLGGIEDVDHLAIAPNWQNGFGISTLTVEANNSDLWTSPPFSTTVTLDSTHGIGIKSITEQSYRYWRFVLTSTLGYCEIANVFIGKATDVLTNGPSYGWSYRNNDLSVKRRNRYGQEFVDEIGQQKEINSLAFQVLNLTEVDKIFELIDNVRTVKPFFVRFGDGSNTFINDEDRFNGMYRLVNSPSIVNTSAGFYNVTMSLRENK